MKVVIHGVSGGKSVAVEVGVGLAGGLGSLVIDWCCCAFVLQAAFLEWLREWCSS
jgi:hypothetical protein